MRGESLPRAEGALGSRQDNSHDLSVGGAKELPT